MSFDSYIPLATNSFQSDPILSFYIANFILSQMPQTHASHSSLSTQRSSLTHSANINPTIDIPRIYRQQKLILLSVSSRLEQNAPLTLADLEQLFQCVKLFELLAVYVRESNASTKTLGINLPKVYDPPIEITELEQIIKSSKLATNQVRKKLKGMQENPQKSFQQGSQPQQYNQSPTLSSPNQNVKPTLQGLAPNQTTVYLADRSQAEEQLEYAISELSFNRLEKAKSNILTALRIVEGLLQK